MAFQGGGTGYDISKAKPVSPEDFNKYKTIFNRLGMSDIPEKLLHRIVIPIFNRRFNKSGEASNAGNDGTTSPNTMDDMMKSHVNLDSCVERAGEGPFSPGKHEKDEQCKYEVNGYVKPGFERVRDAFARNFALGKERDAQLAIYHHGELIVDLHGSNKEPNQSAPLTNGYDANTLQIVFSSTKMMAATVFAVAVDKGWLKYNDNVSKHWPEFAQNGKEHITIADVLRHDAGLNSFDSTISHVDHMDHENRNGNNAKIIAKQKMWKWTVGKDKGKTPRIYHAMSRGFILNQILMRAHPDGKTISQVLSEEVTSKLQADFYFGQYPKGWRSRHHRAFMESPTNSWMLPNFMMKQVVSEIMPTQFLRNDPNALELALFQRSKEGRVIFKHSPAKFNTGAPQSFGDRSLDLEWNEPGYTKKMTRTKKINGFNDMLMLMQSPHATDMESPSSNGYANAKGMARVMAMLSMKGTLNNVRILSEGTVAQFCDKPVDGLDRCNGLKDWMAQSVFVQGGAQASHLTQAATLGKVVGKESFGWGGLGGSALWFNPVDEIGFGYAVTGATFGLAGDPGRLGPIYDALNDCFGFYSKSKL